MSPLEKIKRSFGIRPKRNKNGKKERIVRVYNIMENENVFVNEEELVDEMDLVDEAVEKASIEEPTDTKSSFLLAQIDEFREKAKQLQELMFAREKKAKELQNIVDEKDAKAKELAGELEEKQKIASGITAAIETKIDSLVEKVSEKISEIEKKFDNRAEEDAKLEETVASINKSFNESMEKMKVELEEKIHSEDILCYRNMQSLIEDTDKKITNLSYRVDELSKLKTSVNRLSIIGLVNIVLVLIILFTQYGVI